MPEFSSFGSTRAGAPKGAPDLHFFTERATRFELATLTLATCQSAPLATRQSGVHAGNARYLSIVSTQRSAGLRRPTGAEWERVDLVRRVSASSLRASEYAKTKRRRLA